MFKLLYTVTIDVETWPLGVAVSKHPPVVAGGPGPPTGKCENQ